MTTRRDLPLHTVALRMFSRWQQENFFRYMRYEFALDHLPTTAVEPADPERRVPNPVIKEKKREVGRIQAEQAYGHKAHENREEKVPTVRGFKISHAELGPTITRLRSTRAQLEAAIQALPTRVPVRETMGTTPIVQLEQDQHDDTFQHDDFSGIGSRSLQRECSGNPNPARMTFVMPGVAAECHV